MFAAAVADAAAAVATTTVAAAVAATGGCCDDFLVSFLLFLSTLFHPGRFVFYFMFLSVVVLPFSIFFCLFVGLFRMLVVVFVMLDVVRD